MRCYARSGDRTAARRQLAACIALFRRELGLDPSAAVYRAPLEVASPAREPAVGAVTVASAQLEAGESGLAQRGLGLLRAASGDIDAAA